jgi:hypothetical protein
MELQQILVGLLGSEHVYFQPPESIKFEYPCIVYSLDDVRTLHANNKVYRDTMLYSVTVMDLNPDSEIFKKILELPLCSYDRSFTADNLNHDVLSLYY